jgi:predicted transcriptional regulator
MAGRPSKFTQALATAIADRIATGEPLAVICRDEGMPTDRTVRNWMEASPEFSSAIARAREVGFDALAAECLEIADETGRDTKKGPNDTDICDSEWISRSRLRVETRLKLLAKWDPKRYGEKLALGQAEDLGALTVIINKPA